MKSITKKEGKGREERGRRIDIKREVWVWVTSCFEKRKKRKHLRSACGRVGELSSGVGDEEERCD